MSVIKISSMYGTHIVSPCTTVNLKVLKEQSLVTEMPSECPVENSVDCEVDNLD